jgi:ADP-ribosylglycohydrolase
MKKNQFLLKRSTLLLVLIFNLLGLIGNAQSNDLFKVPVDIIKDKIRGGLLGQILGNLNGLPHEWKYIDEPGKVDTYIPSLPDGAITDDDTDFEWVYIYQMQKNRNIFLSSEQLSNLWKTRINNRIWCSNQYARYLMDIGIQPPYTGFHILNPWAEFNISGQFLCETFGLIAPAMPQTGSKIALNYTTVAIDGEPAQTTQLFTAMIASAFAENDVEKILASGMDALDRDSKVLQVCMDVKKWYGINPKDWKATRQLLKNKYTQEGGKIRDTNGFELNTGAVIAALLYGNGDFSESLRLAFNFGWDADCNAATVGTIVGVMYGYKKMLNSNNNWQIVDRYKNTTRDGMPLDETITSFSDRIIELFELVNEQNGGLKVLEQNVWVYKIPSEKPIPIVALNSIDTKNELLPSIIEGILSEKREEMAKAAYLSICFDINAELARKYPKEWEKACYYLSGYWKIINNLFYVKRPNNEFESMKQLRNKFEIAGFKALKNGFDNKELWTEMETWKDPNILY